MNGLIGRAVAAAFAVVCAGCIFSGRQSAPGDVVIENAHFRLVVGADAVAKSLVVKATGEEMLADPAERVPLFSATQDRPFNNEIKLIHPNKETTYPATSLRREGNKLVAGFAHKQYEARVALRISPHYVAFELEDFVCDRAKTYDYLRMDVPPVASFRVAQLAAANRRHFGDWLNASWDEENALAVVGTSPHADVTHEERVGFRILYADLARGVKLRGGAAAVIAANGREDFLDCMDALERDFGMPSGVASRRSKIINRSIFHVSSDFSPATADEAIRFAKMGGFKCMTLSYGNVVKEIGSWGVDGDYDWLPAYPEKEKSLRALLAKIKAAGISPGIHLMHSHIGLKSRYVTPVADVRLNKTRRFTLAAPIPAEGDVDEIAVFETTADVTRFPACRVLQFGGELFTYEDYTQVPPYRFLGVKRGAHATRHAAHVRGEVGGILDVSEFGSPNSCYLDQNTDLQDEIADKIAKIYACGFEYVYLDGSEGVNVPFNYHVANAQWRVWRKLNPEPLFAEGAAKTHFGWHMLSGANAFDCFPPEIFKEKLREFPFAQAPITRQDMSRVDFGWWNFWAPGSRTWWNGTTVGVQPDMWEYGTSVAAAWDCPMSILMQLGELKKHPRTPDVLETIRRWEDVRERGLMTDIWRKRLKDVSREHHLLLCEDGSYDLVDYEQMEVGNGKNPVRAFVFGKDGATWVVYWHGSGEGVLELSLPPGAVELFDEYAGKPVAFKSSGDAVALPAGPRRYLKTSLSRADVVRAFAKARLR